MKKLLLLAATAAMAISAVNAKIPVKYHGEADLGYSIGVGTFSTCRANLHTIQGVQVYHEFYEIGVLAIPIYLNLKGYIPVSEKVAPYISFDIGTGIGTKVLSGLSGLYCTPAVGIKAGMYKAQVGFNVQRISESGMGFDMNAIQIKVGVMF